MSHRDALFGVANDNNTNNNSTNNNNNNNNNNSNKNDVQQQPMCNFKWVVRGEFIQLESNPNLVIGLPDTEVS